MLAVSRHARPFGIAAQASSGMSCPRRASGLAALLSNLHSPGLRSDQSVATENALPEQEDIAGDGRAATALV